MLNTTDEWLAREHASDLLRQSERERLVQAALRARQPRRPIYSGARLWLGRRLSEWGQHLLTHDSPVDPCAALRQ